MSTARLSTRLAFGDFETHTARHTFVLPSFDAYYGPFERGGASTGQALATLPGDVRAAPPYVMKRGGISATKVDRSKSRPSTASPVVGAPADHRYLVKAQRC